MARHYDIRERMNAARLRALIADLAAGMTFVELARDNRAGPEKKLRNRDKARKVYDSVTRFRNGLTLTPAEEQQLSDGLAKLKSALEQLGESF